MSLGPRRLWLWLFLLFQTAGWVYGVLDDSPCRRGAEGRKEEGTGDGNPLQSPGVWLWRSVCSVSWPHTGQPRAQPSGLSSHFMGWL